MYNTDPEKNGGERNKLTIDNLEAGDKLIFNGDSFRAPRKKSLFLALAVHKKMPFGKC